MCHKPPPKRAGGDSAARRAAEADARANLLAAGYEAGDEDGVAAILQGPELGEALLTIAEFYTRYKLGKTGFYRMQKSAKAIRVIEPVPGMLRISVADAQAWVEARQAESDATQASGGAGSADHPLPARRAQRRKVVGNGAAKPKHRPLFPVEPERLPRKSKPRTADGEAQPMAANVTPLRKQ